MAVKNVIRYVGAHTVPQDIRRARRDLNQMLRRLGTPVIVKHMYTIEDVEKGIAVESENFSSVYKQTRHDDPLSHGVGYSSVERSENEWVSPKGALVVSDVSPGAGYTPAPKYRGFGPGYLTYVILPDVAEDLFKLTESGVLVRTQTAQVQMGFYPEVNDNDLLIIAQIDRNERIVGTRERFQAKMTNPISVRGYDRRGRREYTEDFGNRHIVNQQFEITRVPENDTLYNVETDR